MRLLIPFIIFLSSLGLNTGLAEELHEKKDAIKAILGLEIDGIETIEHRGLRGENISFFTTKDKSALSWRIQDRFYIYSLNGPDHEIKTTRLFTLVKENGIATFVTKKIPDRRDKFIEYFSVMALKINARHPETK